jgi:hypothetical protein
MSDEVKNPFRLVPVPIRGLVLNNTVAYAVAVAHEQKLDRLSLRSRIISLLLDSDPQRARQIVFQMGGQLGLKPRTCNDGLVFDVSEIYVAVGKVASSGFSEKQIAEGERALFVLPWLETFDSPTQINPALNLIEQMRGSAVERQILFSTVSRAMNRKFDDDRSFTSALTWGRGLAANIEKLTSGEVDPLKADLVFAYRSFLVKNLQGTRCRDNEIKNDAPLPWYIESANKLFPQKPLAIEDVTTTDLDDTGKFKDLMAGSPSLKKLKDEFLTLNGRVVESKIVNQSGPEWESRVAEFIEKVIKWEGVDETDCEVLTGRAALFNAMLGSIDNGELKKSVMRKFLRFLAGSDMQKKDFIQWFRYVRDAEKRNEALFRELAGEFHNANFAIMLGAKRILADH